MVATRISRTTKQMVSKEVSTIATELLCIIQQFFYKITRTGAHSVVYYVVEQVLYDFLPQVVIAVSLQRYILT